MRPPGLRRWAGLSLIATAAALLASWSPGWKIEAGALWAAAGWTTLYFPNRCQRVAATAAIAPLAYSVLESFWLAAALGGLLLVREWRPWGIPWLERFSDSREPLAVFDAQSTLRECNMAFAELLGGLPRELLGKTVHELADALGHQASRDVRTQLAKGLPVVGYRTRSPGEGGKERLLTWHFAPMGEGPAMLAMVLDDTAVADAHEAVRVSRERLYLALKGASEAVWDWDARAREAIWLSGRFYQMLGYSRSELPSNVAAIRGLIHSEDRPRFQRSLKRHLWRSEVFDLEFRLRASDGDFLWVRARGDAVRDEWGRAIRLVGAVEDVTAR